MARTGPAPLAAALLAAGLGLAALPAGAQALSQGEIRDLAGRVERLSAELSEIRARLRAAGARPGGAGASLGGEVTLRLDRLEIELSEITGRIEELGYRQRRIAEDGARRIGALDFRLTELEGGDIAALAPQPPLGETGTVAPPPPETAPEGIVTPPPDAAGNGGADADPILALAREDIRQGRYDQGEERLSRLLAGDPPAGEAAEAYYWLGRAQSTRGNDAAAARSFLGAYNSERDGAFAAEALLELGVTLGRLGQTREACLTLRAVRTRFPAEEAEVLNAADAEADRLACGS